MKNHCAFTAAEAKRLFAGLVLFQIFLVAVYVADILLDSPSVRLHRVFDLDAEGNIPAWFASIQLFLIGLGFFLKSRHPDPGAGVSPLFLLVISGGFMFLSADESAGIHEHIGGLLVNHVEPMPQFTDGFGSWIFLYGLIGLAMVLATFRLLAAMWRSYRRPTSFMMLGAGLFLLGAVGFEIVSYEYLRDGSTPLLYKAEVAAEEFLEMFGASVMLYAVMLLLLYGIGAKDEQQRRLRPAGTMPAPEDQPHSPESMG